MFAALTPPAPLSTYAPCSPLSPIARSLPCAKLTIVERNFTEPLAILAQLMDLLAYCREAHESHLPPVVTFASRIFMLNY